MWFKNLKLFRLAPEWQPSLDTFETALQKLPFQPAGRQSMQSLGWVSPTDDGTLAYAQEGQRMVALRTEKKLLPSTVINQVAKEKALEIEAQQGYKPGRKQMKEIKEQVTDELLPRAFSLCRDTRVWFDMRNHWLVIDAASSAKSDEVLGVLAKTMDPFPILPLATQTAPATAMTDWLLSEAPPAGFTVDQEAELRSSGESRAAVRYVRQSLEPDEIQRHVKAGKQCTRLALTWADKVSFVLTDTLDVKRVAPLDVLQENAPPAAPDAREQFDADFALMTGELTHLLDNLVTALGGFHKL